MLGPQDIWIALALGVFFFGAKKLPELSRSLGQAVSEFRKGVTTATDDPPQPAPPVAASTAEITDSRQSSGPTVGEGAPTVNRTEPAQENPKQDHRP